MKLTPEDVHKLLLGLQYLAPIYGIDYVMDVKAKLELICPHGNTKPQPYEVIEVTSEEFQKNTSKYTGILSSNKIIRVGGLMTISGMADLDECQECERPKSNVVL